MCREYNDELEVVVDSISRELRQCSDKLVEESIQTTALGGYIKVQGKK